MPSWRANTPHPWREDTGGSGHRALRCGINFLFDRPRISSRRAMSLRSSGAPRAAQHGKQVRSFEVQHFDRISRRKLLANTTDSACGGFVVLSWTPARCKSGGCASEGLIPDLPDSIRYPGVDDATRESSANRQRLRPSEKRAEIGQSPTNGQERYVAALPPLDHLAEVPPKETLPVLAICRPPMGLYLYQPP
jgi:hypothetical protein